MQHYDFQKTFRAVYDRALTAHRAGASDAASLLTPNDLAFVRSCGGRAQDFLDYAEDAVGYGEPDFETALLIEAVRRDYFIEVQRGTASTVVLDPASLPEKSAAVRGIEWLPRLMPKARAKLRGELPLSLMYCCGGDRRFFKTHDLHPADFLRAVWAFESAPDRLVDWVEERSRKAARA